MPALSHFYGVSPLEVGSWPQGLAAEMIEYRRRWIREQEKANRRR